MTIPRFYHPETMEPGQLVVLTGDHVHYARHVLRMRRKDHLDLIDGRGFEYHARIYGLNADQLAVEILEKKRVRDPSVRITLCQSLLKSDKMDFIVQRGVELGVNTVIPFVSSRSIVRLTDETAAARIRRWQNIAAEAARQCGRSAIPEVRTVATYRDMLGMADKDQLKIIFWEAEGEKTLRQVFQNKEGMEAGGFFFVVGPEGGFTGDEVFQAREADFLSVSIGKRVLKVETAVLSILAITQYERGIFREG